MWQCEGPLPWIRQTDVSLSIFTESHGSQESRLERVKWVDALAEQVVSDVEGLSVTLCHRKVKR